MSEIWFSDKFKYAKSSKNVEKSLESISIFPEILFLLKSKYVKFFNLTNGSIVSIPLCDKLNFLKFGNNDQSMLSTSENAQ